MIRCSRCILPEDFPNIRFDSYGVCNYCRAWDKKWKHFDYHKSEQELIKIFDAARAKKRQYDCLIPYSGGRDSSYVVYLCKNKYKLKPLLVTFNNLFMSSFAMENINSTIQRLGVDHVMVTYKPDTIKKFYRAMVLNGGEFCSVCAAGINHVRVRYQKLYNVPLLISGTSSRVDEQSPFEINSTHPVYVRKVLTQSGFSCQDIDAFVLKRQNDFSAIEKIRMKLSDTDYTQINLPDYVPWDNQEIQRVLENELGWKTPDKHKDHIDCKFASIKYYLKNKQIPHYIFAQEKYSQLIRDGQMTRENAIQSWEKLLEKEGTEPCELEEFLDLFKLERNDIENKESLTHLNYITKQEIEVKESVPYRVLSSLWGLYKRTVAK